MRANAKRAMRPAVVAALFLAFAVCALAKNGRDFAGYYAISKVADSGKAVQVTLAVQVFNNSDDGDIKQPVLALMQPGSRVAHGAFQPIQMLKEGQGAIASGTFTLPKHEFEVWTHRGGGPMVVVLYKNATGRTLQKVVQLSRRPVLPTVAAR